MLNINIFKMPKKFVLTWTQNQKYFFLFQHNYILKRIAQEIWTYLDTRSEIFLFISTPILLIYIW